MASSVGNQPQELSTNGVVHPSLWNSMIGDVSFLPASAGLLLPSDLYAEKSIYIYNQNYSYGEADTRFLKIYSDGTWGGNSGHLVLGTSGDIGGGGTLRLSSTGAGGVADMLVGINIGEDTCYGTMDLREVGGGTTFMLTQTGGVACYFNVRKEIDDYYLLTSWKYSTNGDIVLYQGNGDDEGPTANHTFYESGNIALHTGTIQLDIFTAGSVLYLSPTKQLTQTAGFIFSGGHLYAPNDVVAGNDMDVGVDILIGNDADVGNDLGVGNDLTVSGASLFTGDIEVYADFYVDGLVTTDGGRKKNTTRKVAGQSPYAIRASDDVIFLNTDAGAVVGNLPAGAEGTTYKIINSGTSGNNVTVNPNGAELLIGANSAYTLVDGTTLLITYNATDGWY